VPGPPPSPTLPPAPPTHPPCPRAQGALMNHEFLGALAAVACRQELLLDLIASDEQAAYGAYTFQVSGHASRLSAHVHLQRRVIIPMRVSDPQNPQNPNPPEPRTHRRGEGRGALCAPQPLPPHTQNTEPRKLLETMYNAPLGG